MSEVLMSILTVIALILIAGILILHKISEELEEDKLFKQEMNKGMSSSTSIYD